MAEAVCEEPAVRQKSRWRDRRVPSSLPPLPIAAMWLAVVLGNAWFTAWTIAELVAFPTPVDWVLFTTAAERISSGANPYGFDVAGESFRWSPVIAWGFAAISAIGEAAWRILHFAALLFLPSRRLAVIALVSWPFWFDVATGNVMTFVFVMVVHAMRGSRVASVLVIATAILIPRPLMLPVVAWVLWRDRFLAMWTVGLFAVHVGSLALTGWSVEWVARLLETGQSQVGIPFDVGPARLIGLAWIPIGLVLAALLLRRGRPGWASLAASPYWLPYYLFMPLVELDRNAWPAAGKRSSNGRAANR
jgi:uncharacterized membrane protein